MRYVCDAPGGKTWFRIESDTEAVQESELMGHAVQKYFRQARERARASYAPLPGPFFEQEIGLKDHIERLMPLFVTLRDAEGNGLATAMLPARGRSDAAFDPIWARAEPSGRRRSRISPHSIAAANGKRNASSVVTSSPVA